jgi:hypothetical protein
LDVCDTPFFTAGGTMREALLDRISELEVENVALRRLLLGMTQPSGVP